MASEGDDAIPTNTREVKQLEISQPDIWPVLNPVCARVNYRVLRVFLKQGGFHVKRIHAILCETSRRFRTLSCALSRWMILCLSNPSRGASADST